MKPLWLDETFPQYKHNAEIEGAAVIEVPLKEGTHDLPAILAKVTDHTKIIWICNPNNPSGTLNVSRRLAFCQVPNHVTIRLDEAYDEYVIRMNFRTALR